MDRPAVTPSPADDHWAPEHLVIARQPLTYAGRLVVEREPDGTVATYSPLADMAAVEQRYPAWALGPFGTIDTERDLPDRPGVFALTQAGVVRYVGSAANLSRGFGPRGLGQISRRDCQNPKHEEQCRLNRLVTAEARAGRLVDLYVLLMDPPRAWGLLPARGEAPASVAARLAAAAHGSWHLPT